MPWTGPSFAKHNHSLSPVQSAHAAKIANHVLQSTGSDRIAIATANKLARRDDGGALAGSPMGGMQATARRYAAMPEEKLQEAALMLGSSPQGEVARRVLQQRRMTGGSQAMGATDTDGLQHRAMGGPSFSEANPWWERQEAYAASRPATGFLSGATPGRADSLKTTAPSGSYVMPADVIAGLGEGNSLSGAHVMDMILRTGPHGIPMPRGARGMGPPRPPHAISYQAKGGGVQYGSDAAVPVALSHGEYVVTPEQVAVLGGGDVKRGHRILDELVMELRARHIKKLQKLKAPVGSGKK